MERYVNKYSNYTLFCGVLLFFEIVCQICILVPVFLCFDSNSLVLMLIALVGFIAHGYVLKQTFVAFNLLHLPDRDKILYSDDSFMINQVIFMCETGVDKFKKCLWFLLLNIFIDFVEVACFIFGLFMTHGFSLSG